LGFIAADSKGTDQSSTYILQLFESREIEKNLKKISDGEYWTEFILVTDYHEHGSLYDYLSKNVLSVEQV